MAESARQDLGTHRRWYPLYHFVALPILLGNFFFVAWRAAQDPTKNSIWQAIVAFGIAAIGWTGRSMALRVQDRVIRLEMRLRFKDLLTPALYARTSQLSRRQVVGLRFAGDAELSGLVERCLSGELANGEAVKKQIRDWQADWLRA
jgi:hypothetical protein